MIEIDQEIGRKLTKFSLIGYAFLFFLSPAQPLLCSTLMGLAALPPILLGPNPLRILGLLAFAVAGYLFWPEYQESKKIPTRNEVRLALSRAEAGKVGVAEYVAQNRRLPEPESLDLKLPGDDKVAYELLPGGAIRVQMKTGPLAGLSVRWVPTLSGGVAPAAAPVDPAPPTAPVAAAPVAAAPVSPPEGASDGAAVQAPAPAVVASAPVPMPAPAGPPPKLSWSCISDDISQSYLPVNCRNSENLRKAARIAK